MSERVVVFIDGQNLFMALMDDFKNPNIDFEKLVHKLVDDRKLIRVYYYTALPDQKKDPEQYRKQQGFLDALRDKPYFAVRQGRLVPRGNSYVEKGVDIYLAVDMLEMGYNNAYDTAILISGDGDMSRAVEVVKRQGKHVENAITKKSQSRHLRQTCDTFTLLDKDFLKGCWR